MGQTLAVKYRPQTFEDVCGQTITVKILERILESGSLKHTYLFAGDSGCGKTTCARIFANRVNGGVGSPIEIDAASNNGVDQVRAIVESSYQRDLAGEYKIFIIDECHAITPEGWKAFLKCIEEPPEYTIFIFCTTEPQKLPQPILNRLQRYNFTKIDSATIKARLELICQKEGFTNYEKTCDLISKTTHGCMRDAVMKLDQCADFSHDLNVDVAKQVLSGVSFESMFKLTWALQNKQEDEMLKQIDEMHDSGEDLKGFIDSYLEFVLDLLKFSLFRNIELTDIPAYLASEDNAVVQYTVDSQQTDGAWFRRLVDALLEVKQAIKYDSSYKSTIEAYLLRFCRG